MKVYLSKRWFMLLDAWQVAIDYVQRFGGEFLVTDVGWAWRVSSYGNSK